MTLMKQETGIPDQDSKVNTSYFSNGRPLSYRPTLKDLEMDLKLARQRRAKNGNIRK